MTAEERRHRIENYLQTAEFATLEELARKADVSVSTVRRDLSVLEAGGGIKRTHGGVRALAPKGDEFVFAERDARQLAEKEAIGRACADLILPNQTVIFDAGSTVYHVARYLGEKSPQIVTNSLPIANLYASATRVEVLLVGGVIYPRLGVLVGPSTVEAFTRLRADVAVMGAGGITEEGVTNSHVLLIDIQRAMMQAARRVIFCLDHTKFDRQSVSPLCGLEQAGTVVTDSGASPEMLEKLRARGVEVVVAPATVAMPAEN